MIFKGIKGVSTLITAGYNSTTDVKGIAVNPLAFGDAAYKPQMSVGTQTNTSPASIATGSGREEQPSNPSTPTKPSNPATPTNPTYPTYPGTTNPPPGGGGDDNTGVDVNFK